MPIAGNAYDRSAIQMQHCLSENFHADEQFSQNRDQLAGAFGPFQVWVQMCIPVTDSHNCWRQVTDTKSSFGFS